RRGTRDPRGGREADRAQHEARATDARRGDGTGTPATGSRVARRRQVGRARDERFHQHRQEGVRRAFALCLSAAALTGCNGGTVDRHALKRDAEKVGSLAAEGELLADDVSKDASTTYFARVHAEELSQAASNL